MEDLIINASGCLTALQFLAIVSKALGTPIGTFSTLNHYLLTNYYPRITFLGTKKFSERCPHTTKEIEVILQRVQWHYEKERKKFEYKLQLS